MNEIEEAIARLEHEMIDALLKRDIETLERILAAEFIITDPNGPSLTRERYLNDLRMERISFSSLTVDELEVRSLDGTAVVTGKATAQGRSADGPYQGQYSFMDVYVKKVGGWQAILSAVNRA